MINISYSDEMLEFWRVLYEYDLISTDNAKPIHNTIILS